jgi:hypothetical protein
LLAACLATALLRLSDERGLTGCAGAWQLPVQWISGSEGLEFVCVHRVMLQQMLPLTKIYNNSKNLAILLLLLRWRYGPIRTLSSSTQYTKSAQFLTSLPKLRVSIY